MSFASDPGAAKELAQRLKELSQKVGELSLVRDQLSGNVEEQNESYNRVSERLIQSREEITLRERELNTIRSKVAAAKQETRDLLSPTSRPQGGVQQDTNLTTEEAIAILRRQLDDISESVGVIPPSSEIKSTVGSQILYVSVECSGDVCGFRITPSYTFAQLTQDTCRYWNMDPVASTLRDETNTIWPTQGVVRDVIKEELTKQEKSGSVVSLPKIKLVGPERKVTSVRTDLAMSKGVDDDGDVLTTRQQQDFEREYLARLVLENDRERRSSKRKNKLKQRIRNARVAMAKNLSDMFHDPHEQPYSNRSQMFKSAEALEEDGAGLDESSEEFKLQTRFAGTCGKLICWLAFVCLLVTATTLRYMTAVVYSATVSFQSRLAAPFSATEPLNFVNGTTRWIYSSTGQSHATVPAVESPVSVYPFSQVEDVYNFLRTNLGPSFLEQESDGRFSLVNEQQQLLGPIMFKQNRVTNTSCETGSFSQVLVNNQTCFGAYSVTSEESGDLGLAQQPPENATETQLECYALFNQGSTFSGSEMGEESDLSLGVFSAYNQAGYVIQIPKNASLELFNCVVDLLEESGWLDESTRALFVSFVVLNANIDFLVGTQVRVEMNPSGDVYSSLMYDRVKLNLYDENSFNQAHYRVSIASDVFCLLYTAGLFYGLVLDVIVFGAIRTLNTAWNFVSLLIFCTSYCAVILRIVYTVKMNEFVDNTDPVTVFTYQGLEKEFRLFEVILWMDMFTVVLAIILVFKYTQGNRRVSAVFETVYRSSRVAAALIFLVLVLIFASIFAAFLVYGTKLPGWRSFQGVTSMVLSFMMGDLFFTTFRGADVFFSIFFFAFFIIYFCFIAVAFITAIYIDSFFEVSAVGLPKARPSKFWSKVITSPFFLCRTRWRRKQGKVKTN